MQTAARLVVGFVLCVAGAAKLTSFSGFRRVIATYKLLPRWLERPFALWLVGAEISIGTALCANFGFPKASYAAASLLALFSTAVLANITRNRNHSCGCFRSDDKIGWQVVVRNLCLICLALISARERQPNLGELALYATSILLLVITLGPPVPRDVLRPLLRRVPTAGVRT